MSHTNLFTLDNAGRTVPASADEVIAAARQHIARRFRRGVSLSSPEVMRDFLRLNLGTREFETFCCLFLDLCGPISNVQQCADGAATLRCRLS
jgi:DNA repair protein RadC